MRESFDARITDPVAISALDGHRRLVAGRYRVSVHYDERGGIAGAELTRIDVQGPRGRLGLHELSSDCSTGRAISSVAR
jgi:hypothetical protein